jgi:membrane-associated phospholipid phosphatase
VLRLIKKNITFIAFYLVILIAGSITVLLYSKTDIHLTINNLHSPFLDKFFKYITYLGSGITAGIVAVFLLFVRLRYSIILAVSAVTSGVVVQLLKRLVFPGCERPVVYFHGIAELYYVPGIDLHTHFSFPSGHSVTAFIIFGLFAFVSDREPIKISALLVSFIISYSRVYLSQHFLVDILAGSFLGMITILFFYWYFHTLKGTWINKPVQSFFRSVKK